MPSIYFRIVKASRPAPADFLSYEALGIPLPPNATEEQRRIHSGVSVYVTEAQARRKARGVRSLGGYIAELEIPGGAPVRAERTTASSGHYTLWAPPDVLAGTVVSTVPV